MPRVRYLFELAKLLDYVGSNVIMVWLELGVAACGWVSYVDIDKTIFDIVTGVFGLFYLISLQIKQMKN